MNAKAIALCFCAGFTGTILALFGVAPELSVAVAVASLAIVLGADHVAN